jgi:hypothetical protein
VGQVSANTNAVRAWSAVREPATSRGKSWFDVGRMMCPLWPMTVVAVAHSARNSAIDPAPEASK